MYLVFLVQERVPNLAWFDAFKLRLQMSVFTRYHVKYENIPIDYLWLSGG